MHLTSIRRAKNLAEVVFSKDIRNNLDSALQHIENFAEFTEKGVLDLHPDLTLELRTDLQTYRPCFLELHLAPSACSKTFHIVISTQE